MYAAKYKLTTVAAVFKIAGNDLGKPLGSRAQKVVGVDNSPNKQLRLDGIKFDRYHKIPEHKGNKIQSNWKPEYKKLLEKCTTPTKLLQEI